MRLPASARRDRGMTLAELLVVITIITLAATLILPVVLNLTRTQRVGSGVRVVQALLHGARTRAVAARSRFGLVIDRQVDFGPSAARTRYACLVVDDLGNTAPNQKREALPYGLGLRLYLGGNPNPQSPMPIIWFAADGTVDTTRNPITPIVISFINEEEHETPDTADILIRRTGVIEVSD